MRRLQLLSQVNEKLLCKSEVKSLVLLLSFLDILCDDTDIARQARNLYCAANKLKTHFFKCSIEVKNILFRAHCMCFYASQLW